jgi:SNF2 family DNA or RNA helicase
MDDELDNIINKYTETEQELTKSQKDIENVRSEMDAARRRRDALRQMLEDTNKQLTTLSNALAHHRTRAQEQNRTLQRLERKKTQAEKESEIRRHYEEASRSLNLETIGAPWREFALDHQIKGATHLAIAGRGILGDKRGLGKTLTSLIWLDMVKARKVIIFVPKEAATAFRKQMPKWSPHRSLFDLVAQKPNIRKAFLNSLKQLPEWNILINLEAWRRDPSIIRGLVELGPEAVIIDEAHSIKDDRTTGFKGIRAVVYPDSDRDSHYGVGHLPPTVKHVLPMSGTSYLNYPVELWPLLHLIDRQSWPSKSNFIADYLYAPTAPGKYAFNPFSNSEEKLLRQLGSRFIQRDRKSAGIKIPPQEIQYHDIDWDIEQYPNQYKAYNDLVKHCAIVLDSMSEDDAVGVEGLALFTRLRQMLTWPAGIKIVDPVTGIEQICNIHESIKIDFAYNLIEQIYEEEDRCVVFSQFRAPLHELCERLNAAGISSVVLDGSTSPQERELIKTDFDAAQTTNGNHRWDVVLCNYKVGGQSLDFTAATQMVCLDMEWNPGKMEQAFGRIDRMGQTKETTVHVLRVTDTIDTVMQAIIDAKAEGILSFESVIKQGIEYVKENS